MSGGITAAIIGTGYSIYENERKKKAEAAQAKAASQPTSYDRYRQTEPWGPTADARQQLIQQAMALLGGSGAGPGGGGSTGGASATANYASSPSNPGSSFGEALFGDTTISQDEKMQIQNIASGLSGKSGEAYNQGVQALHQAIYASGLGQATKDRLAGMYQYLGSAGGAQAAASGGGSRSGGGGGGGGGKPPGGTNLNLEAYLKDILDGNWLDKGNPYLDEMIAAARRGQEPLYARSDIEAIGAGMLGGSGDGVRKAALDRGMYETDIGLRFGVYDAERARMMEALGIGTNYDSNLRGIAANRYATSSANSRAANALGFERYKFDELLPYQKLGSVANILNAAGGQYDTVHEWGTEQGRQYAAPYSQDWLSAGIQGGIGLANQWKGLQDTFGWGK